MNTRKQTLEAEPISQATVITLDVPVPVATMGYDTVRYNAQTHGILTKLVVLAHEDHAEFDDLLAALIDEHQPAGMTDRHLIEELAIIIWRKRRVLLAEGATINRSLQSVVTSGMNSPIPAAAPFEKGLSGSVSDLKRILMITPERAEEVHEEAELLQRSAWKARSVLRKKGANAYAKACRVLLPEALDSWESQLAAGKYQADAEGLADFINEVLEPVLSDLEKQARYQTAIKTQTLGEGLQAYRLEKLSRYETHLDRKFERTLAMLLKLKELRGG